MKKILIQTFLFLLFGLPILAQEPSLALGWQKNIGGTGDEFDLISTQNFQGDIFISGSSTSPAGGDIPGNKGGSDIYVAKLSADGSTTHWAKTFGGTLNDFPASIAPTSDGGLIILCYANSIDHDFNSVSAGIWLLKLNNDGTTGFKEFYGGNPGLSGKVIQTTDGGYIFHSTKNVTSNALDLWVVKTNSAGTITWQNTYGGTSDEFSASILEFNNNYYVLGESASATVNGQSNHGLTDLLFLKINNVGAVQWTKLFGGPGNDGGTSLVLDDSNNFLVLGSNSAVGGNVFSNNGGVDFWIVNFDDTGFSSNNSSLGGSKDDYPADIYFSESSFRAIVTGEIFSDWLPGPEPDTSNVLAAELIPFGGTQWSKVLGGSSFESPKSIIGTLDGGLLISGHSFSSDGDLTGNKGGSDFWLIKLAYACPDELQLNAATFTKSLSRKADSFIDTNSTYTGTSSRVKLRSNYLLMQPGFKVEPGTVFETEIGGCSD